MKYRANVTAAATAYYDCDFNIEIPDGSDPYEYVRDLIKDKNYEDLCDMELDDFDSDIDGLSMDDNDPELELIRVEEV